MADKTTESEATEVTADESLADVLSNALGDKLEVTDEKPEETETTEEDKKTEETESEDKDSTSEPEKDQSVPLAALLDERDKRQKLKADLEERDARIAELTKGPETKRPDVFEDQEGAFEHVFRRLDNERLNDKFSLSRDFMSMLKDDFEEREGEFYELAKESPELRDQLLAHANPARFAYDTAVRHKELKEMENIDDVRAKIRAEEREKLVKEMEDEGKERDEKDAKNRDAITPSLATKRSSGRIEGDPGDESLDEAMGAGRG